MKLTLVPPALLAALALASSAQAALITGNIELSANSSVVTIDYGANTVTFNPSAPAQNAKVDASSGTLGALMGVGSTLTYQNFQYDPLLVTNPIWSNGTTSFSLQSISIISEIPGKLLYLFGSGVINTTVQGYDPTPGTWSFSADSSGASFAWSSTATTQVPDGGTTIALLGASLLGLGAARRFLPALRK